MVGRQGPAHHHRRAAERCGQRRASPRAGRTAHPGGRPVRLYVAPPHAGGIDERTNSSLRDGGHSGAAHLLDATPAELAKCRGRKPSPLDGLGASDDLAELEVSGVPVWLDDIQVALEQVHSAVFSDNQEALRDALTIVDEWPWQMLRAPRYAAETRYLWSNAVDTGLREAFGISASWTPYARPAVLAQMTHETRMAALGAERADRWAQSHPPESEDIRGEMWGKQRSVVSRLNSVRNQVRQEMT
jgi:hypothetical protein